MKLRSFFWQKMRILLRGKIAITINRKHGFY